MFSPDLFDDQFPVYLLIVIINKSSSNLEVGAEDNPFTLHT